MSIDIGIIGLPQSGKTTVFNALTSGKADTASHTTEGLTPHIGVARIPEPRLMVLEEMLHPKKVVPVEARAYLTPKAAWMSSETSLPSIWNSSSLTWLLWKEDWKE
jgi:hypothetical protein